MKKWREFVILCVLFWAPHVRAAEQTTIKETDSTVSIGNDLVRLDYDLKKGTYSIIDVADNVVAIENARSDVDRLPVGGIFGWFDNNLPRDAKLSWTEREISDELGVGKTLDITYERKNRAGFLTSFTIRDGKSFIVMIHSGHNSFSKDKVHPNAVGAKKMAVKWLVALLPALGHKRILAYEQLRLWDAPRSWRFYKLRLK
jgi:hypothetical protein